MNKTSVWKNIKKGNQKEKGLEIILQIYLDDAASISGGENYE